MDANLQHDHSLGSQAVRPREGTYGGSRQTQHARERPFALRYGEHAIHVIALAVALDAHVVHVGPIGALVIVAAYLYLHRHFGGLGFGVLPKFGKIVRKGRGGKDLFGLETDGGVSRVGGSFVLGGDADGDKSGGLRSGDFDLGLAIAVGGYLAFEYGGEFFGTVLVVDHHAGQHFIVLEGIEGKLRLLAHPIYPIGMIRRGGDRYILLCGLGEGRQQASHPQQSEKKPSFDFHVHQVF